MCSFSLWHSYDLIIGLRHIHLHHRVLNQVHIVISDGNENGLLVFILGLEPEREVVGQVQSVLVYEVQVGVVFDRGVDEGSAVYGFDKREKYISHRTYVNGTSRT